MKAWRVGNRAKKPEITAGGYTPEQLCAQREFEVVMLNLENVRESSRPVMELRVKHDLSEIEIAQVLNLTLSAVKARLYRGRLDLREAMSISLDSAKLARTRKNMPHHNREARTVAPLHRCQRAGKRQPVTSTIQPVLFQVGIRPAVSFCPAITYANLALFRLAAQKLLFEYAGASEALKTRGVREQAVESDHCRGWFWRPLCGPGSEIRVGGRDPY